MYNVGKLARLGAGCGLRAPWARASMVWRVAEDGRLHRHSPDGSSGSGGGGGDSVGGSDADTAAAATTVVAATDDDDDAEAPPTVGILSALRQHGCVAVVPYDSAAGNCEPAVG